MLAVLAPLALSSYLGGAAIPRSRIAPSTRPALQMNANMQKNALAAALAASISLSSLAANAAEPWAYSTLLEKVNADEVAKVAFSEDGSKVIAFGQDGGDHNVQVFPGADAELVQELRKHQVQFAVVPKPESNSAFQLLGGIGGLLINFLPLILLIGLNVLANRGGGGGPMGGMGGPGGIGKSKAQVQMEPNTGVTFEDVAGCDGSKMELTEIVEFLKNPSKFSALGAKIPRGAIMEGPPGTGKTLLARAVAGEAGVPFISASGSEFVEMFVGVGAARIRSLFGEAKKNAPCIVFIDEIDAVGRQRAGSSRGGMGGGNDEREQTLNQILTEMDGFEGNAGVIVIAATNRADVLDSALLRPGRFDRRVPVDLPDKDGRLAILKVHSRGKPLSDDVQLDIVAKRTIGFSGASLANLMNEAAIVSARRDKTEISYGEIDYAIDRLTVGMQKTTGISFPNRQRLVAYHEAGHAVMGALTPDYDMVTKVTIIPRTNGAGGFTLFTPSEERLESGLYSKRYLEGQLAVALGGRVAEEIIFGEEEVTTGASNDLQQVRNIARRMVAQWGYSMKKIGAVAWEAPEGNGGFGPQAASPETEKVIDAEVKEIVAKAYKVCKDTLVTNRELLEELTEMLIDKETVDFTEMQELVSKYHPEIVDAQKLTLPAEAQLMS
uniref:AAA+ ATPase domain-containing protein n=2 Tax=Calcidiscus leptoporus TaxID=127549 RepID=A0A7S0IUI6_9EUKA|mmetsp:Transcript_23591/g.54631  ORF Transcript_23591/g.54631 Transcript_23591/m.54631 type:complete len:666 (+) Transcript_23591:69-2066(+)